MKRKSRNFLPFAILGVSLIALLVVFVGFMLKDTGKNTEIAEAESEVATTVSEVVSPEENLDNSETSEALNEEELKSDDAAEAVSDGPDNEAEIAKEDPAETENPQDLAKANEEASQEETVKEDSSEEQEQPEETKADEPAEEVPAGTEQADAAPAEAEPAEEAPAVLGATPHTGGHLIVIDPGHQSKAMTDKEPNGPGSSNMKMKVTAGTAGKTTGLAESQLNLTIGLMLRDELRNRGYTVIMTRESQDVSLSNVDRAQIANNAGAEAFIRIHANGSDDSSVNGALTICQTPSNPYNGGLHDSCRRLSDCVLDSYCASTGFKKQYVWETDTMTGINWANVPSTIIEMGYMSNPTDDTNMASPDYQKLMTIGIANGIDNYFAN